MKEDFKVFVRKKPELINYVKNGNSTWQQIYEKWSLYGEDDSYWNDIKEEKENKDFSIDKVTDIIKKIDMNQVQKGINSLQKIVELLQGFTLKDTLDVKTGYEPRQLFKKFED